MRSFCAQFPLMIASRVSLWQIAALLISIFVPLSAPAAEVISGPEARFGETAVTIEWRTDVETGTRVKYGLAPDQLTTSLEGTVCRDHVVVLPRLKPVTTYYYAVGTSKRWLAEGSFTTPAAGGSTMASTPKPPPVIGKSAPTPAPANKLTPPPTRVTWGNLDSLADHFNRHGADFHASSADDYAAQAWAFLQRARQQSLPMKWDASDRTLRVWEPSTRSFAAYDQRGKTRTYFKPSNPAYWTRQPGTPVKPSELPF